MGSSEFTTNRVLLDGSGTCTSVLIDEVRATSAPPLILFVVFRRLIDPTTSRTSPLSLEPSIIDIVNDSLDGRRSLVKLVGDPGASASSSPAVRGHDCLYAEGGADCDCGKNCPGVDGLDDGWL